MLPSCSILTIVSLPLIKFCTKSTENAFRRVSCAWATFSANVQQLSRLWTQLSQTFCGNKSSPSGKSNWQHRLSFCFSERAGSPRVTRWSSVFRDAHKRQISVMFSDKGNFFRGMQGGAIQRTFEFLLQRLRLIHREHCTMQRDI